MDEDEAYMRHLEQVNTGAPVLSGTPPGNRTQNLLIRTIGIEIWTHSCTLTPQIVF